MEVVHPVEGSIHPRGQVVTLHLNKQEKVYETDIQSFIIHQFQEKKVLQRRNQHKKRCKVKTSSFHKCCQVVLRCQVVRYNQVDSGCRTNKKIS